MIQNRINGKRYFGYTKNSFRQRYGVSWWKKVCSKNLIEDLMEFGKDNFEVVEEFASVATKKQALELENYLILEYKTSQLKYGYNINESFNFTRRLKFNNDLMLCFDSSEDATNFHTLFDKFISPISSPYLDENDIELFKKEHWFGQDFEQFKKLYDLFIDRFGYEEYRLYTIKRSLGVTSDSVFRLIS